MKKQIQLDQDSTKKGLFGVCKPTKFVVQINHCGTDTLNGSYKKMENESALRVLLDAVFIMTKDFVGKEAEPYLQYDLACALLNTLNGIKQEDLLKKINLTPIQQQEILNKWRIINEETKN